MTSACDVGMLENSFVLGMWASPPCIWNLWWTSCLRLTRTSFTIWSVVSGIVSGRHFLCLSLTLAGFLFVVRQTFKLKLYIIVAQQFGDGISISSPASASMHCCIVSGLAKMLAWKKRHHSWFLNLSIAHRNSKKIAFAFRSSVNLRGKLLEAAVWAFIENVDVSFVFFEANVPWIARPVHCMSSFGKTMVVRIPELRLPSRRHRIFKPFGPLFRGLVRQVVSARMLTVASVLIPVSGLIHREHYEQIRTGKRWAGKQRCQEICPHSVTWIILKDTGSCRSLACIGHPSYSLPFAASHFSTFESRPTIHQNIRGPFVPSSGRIPWVSEKLCIDRHVLQILHRSFRSFRSGLHM